MQDFLQSLFGRLVDLVTESGLGHDGMWRRTSYVSRDGLLYIDDVIDSAEKIQPHRYFAVDPQIVWDAATMHVPTLLREAKMLRRRAGQAGLRDDDPEQGRSPI